MGEYKFGKLSNQKLEEVHPDLVKVVREALSYGVMDFSVNEGLRSAVRQKKLFEQGATKTLKSKHLRQNTGYGHAVDLYPYPIDMGKVNSGNAQEIIRFGVLAGLMFAAARKHGVVLRWGGDWDSDGETLDHSFFDAPHFELVI